MIMNVRIKCLWPKLNNRRVYFQLKCDGHKNGKKTGEHLCGGRGWWWSLEGGGVGCMVVEGGGGGGGDCVCDVGGPFN